MVPVSIVIITKNEAEVIASCINAAKLISDDIIVIDNDSIDETREIAYKNGCNVYRENWDGYGANKNKGIAVAKYNWILSIDADEVPDEELVRALHNVKFNNPEIVYDIRFKSYYGQKLIRFGAWGRDHHVRLFNRKLVKWSETPVHETLILPATIVTKRLNGYLQHYSVKDNNDFLNKTIHYAKLSASKYLASGKKATPVKLYVAPLFHFIKNYIVFLGFMDGREGLNIAKMISKHTRIKYRLLKAQAKRGYQQTPAMEDNFVVEY
ncbi:MAG: glycosyltransferase family 2 protein [Mucilaginibacter sp.]|nr:glycosyltransferase family 2 protein [Mucilaginibacter sp.]